MNAQRYSALLIAVALCVAIAPLSSQAPAPANRRTEFERLAKAALAQHQGTFIVRGVREPVEVLRDQHGIPHIYAKNTHDLFFAQGFTVAQDRMWQLELWRRNGEGKLAEVLGPDYVTRDRFARLLAFRGNWDEEMKKYHPEGPVIFDAFAQGVNMAIQKAIDEQKVPVEFRIMGFQPLPHWTAKTLLTRMPGWTLSRNVAGEVQRALDVKALGLEKTRELKPTDPETPFVVPPGLDLEDITADILAITRGANDIRWDLTPAELRADALTSPSPQSPAPSPEGDYTAGFGSNNWVISGKKSATGMPLIANDPHREVVNPALRYVVHLNAPGWNAIGATEPGLPGISIGHNDRVAWGFTILGMDQQDLYVEETDPANPKRYRWKGAWEEMSVEREFIWVKGRPQPDVVDLSFTRHGPVLHENTGRNRAYALKWVGAEPGGAGYLGSLNVMQAKNLEEFRAALPKAWYLPSHSLVYADVDGNFAYFGVALTPQRKNWDGLMPVPGKDGQYEWDRFVPFEQLPFSKNDPRGFYNSSNNDVVPKIVPGYKIPLGYEYSAPYRYERAFEVLSQAKTVALGDMEKLQQDATSLPARALVPLLRQVRGPSRARPTTTTAPGDAARSVGFAAGQGASPGPSGDTLRAIDQLLAWNHVLDKTSTAATIYEYWFLRLQPLAYAPRVPEAQRATFRAFDPRRVIAWMTRPDAAYGASRRDREAARNRILLEAMDQAVADLRKAHGEKWADVPWGQVHTARFTHPLANSPATRELFALPAVAKSGDAYTLLASSSATEAGADQASGASYSFVFDVKDWDNSTGLNAPGQSAQPLSPHYGDLAPLWGDGKGVPMAFSRAKVDSVVKSRLVLQPLTEHLPAAAAPAPGLPAFEPLQPATFAAHGAQANAWGDYDGDGDLDLFVGFRGRLDRLYRNDAGTFTDVAMAVGLGDTSETRAAAWGDYDSDGDLDLYVGFSVNQTTPNKLYRNDGAKGFVNVARALGVEDTGTTRQPAWIDLDGDNDLDLFVAWRDRPNSLYRNDGGTFTDVAKDLGLADPRKSVGAVWFDMDADGDLDLFVANQEGDPNGLFRNASGKFTDIADAAGVSGKGRSPVLGGVGPAVADYDLDGDLDLFVANYGPDELFRNDGDGRFTDVAPALGLAGDTHETTAGWGDVDNDGDPDLYLASFLTNVLSSRDKLFRNDRTGFVDVTPASVLKWDASHGVQWVDVDADGAIDLSLADNHPLGRHQVHRNLGAGPNARAVAVRVLDANGRATTAGAEVRAYKTGTRELVASATVDAGSGYCSQSVQPVHLGIGSLTAVDVEVSLPRGGKRLVARASATAGTPVVVRVGS